jgi:uncharacterized protein
LLSKGLFSKALLRRARSPVFDSGGENRYYAAFVPHETEGCQEETPRALPKAAVNQFVTRKFAADRQVATGTVRLSDWDRAKEAVVDPNVEIGYRVEGGADPQGRPMLMLELSGTVELICQRSLHPMPFPLGRRTPVLLAADQREADLWDRETDDAEVVVADQPLELATLLEDELLLSLPYSPLCDDPECAQKLRLATGAGAEPIAAEGVENASPFSVLRGTVSKQSH